MTMQPQTVKTTTYMLAYFAILRAMTRNDVQKHLKKCFEILFYIKNNV